MRKPLPILSVLLLLPLLALAPGAVGAQEEADCEKHLEALAYNACLAALGPEAGKRGLEERRRSTVEQRRRGNPVQRRSDGRKAATFDIITGRK